MNTFEDENPFAILADDIQEEKDVVELYGKVFRNSYEFDLRNWEEIRKKPGWHADPTRGFQEYICDYLWNLGPPPEEMIKRK
jgi:hypothetical protein